MRAHTSALAVVVAAVLVCCRADPRQEQEGDSNGPNRFEGKGEVPRLARQARSWLPFLAPRRQDMSPFSGRREAWPLAPAEFAGFYGLGLPKRNFDEIDRSGLDNFVKKRNFDEIDQTSMPFPFKRFVHLYVPNYVGTADFNQKRNRADYPMDEIDLSSFPIGSKRSVWPGQ